MQPLRDLDGVAETDTVTWALCPLGLCLPGQITPT